MADEPGEKKAPAASVKFVYFHCNDIDAMRGFYTDLLGMDEASYRNDDEYAWLVYNCGSFQFMVFPADAEVPKLDGWGAQPGWPGGKLSTTSWSVEVSEEQYAATVARLQEADVPLYSEQPMWCQDCYWSFPVRDPMGNTVEVYTMLAERPESTVWPERP